MKMWIFFLWKLALYKAVMEFILLLDGIKCWYNYPLRVLTNAPALHSLIICNCKDAVDTLEFLNHKHVDLRRLVILHCKLGEDGTGLLANIMESYQDLEGLVLSVCGPLTSTSYRLILRLKKLSELAFSYCQVYYVCVKLLDTHFCIRNACRGTLLHF